MTRRPALISQADVVRALRAARQTGAEAVEVQRDGRITILLKAPLITPADEFEAWEREHEQAKAAGRRQRD